jgi:hypothetical protein
MGCPVTEFEAGDELAHLLGAKCFAALDESLGQGVEVVGGLSEDGSGVNTEPTPSLELLPRTRMVTVIFPSLFSRG